MCIRDSIALVLPFGVVLGGVRYCGTCDAGSRTGRLDRTVECLLAGERAAKAAMLFPFRVVPYTVTVLRRGRGFNTMFQRVQDWVDAASDRSIRCLIGVFVDPGGENVDVNEMRRSRSGDTSSEPSEMDALVPGAL
eukprot:TRINITY_DN51456_c0_g1_i1.p1 TRINITY_DN51456_c0_g1~~TRINITY_DN51456_c0_g1_i1.p1  ORF type:complete len:136 (+),score=27.64 TRINITY_DN51456_c0_g1_i1:144-551(+)